MTKPLLIMAGACLGVLCSCAPVPPQRSTVSDSPPRPAEKAAATPGAEVPPVAPAPTIAERAAQYDVQHARATESPSSTGSAARAYAEGYPVLAPAPKARRDGSLQSFLTLNTGPYLANQQVHNLTWTNNSGRTLAIYKAYLWTGVDKGATGDVQIEARRASDNSYIAVLLWDHYADPTLPQHGQQFDYPSPMMLDPGDSITITHLANGFKPGSHAHHLMILWVK